MKKERSENFIKAFYQAAKDRALGEDIVIVGQGQKMQFKIKGFGPIRNIFRTSDGEKQITEDEK